MITTPNKNLLLSFSGGVDSTAMLALLLEQHHRIHQVVFFDTGWEHPQLYAHIAQVEQTFQIHLIRIQSDLTFNYLLQAHPVKYRTGPYKTLIKHYGRGWPTWSHRWCTGEKVKALERYADTIHHPLWAIGYDHGEHKRTLKRNPNKHPRIYPLLDQKITHEKAHEICRAYGFHWHELYHEFDRMACFCCPFQRVHQLQTIHSRYPDLWHRIHQMDQRIGPPKRIFAKRKTFDQLDRRFTAETKQLPPVPKQLTFDASTPAATALPPDRIQPHR